MADEALAEPFPTAPPRRKRRGTFHATPSSKPTIQDITTQRLVSQLEGVQLPPVFSPTQQQQQLQPVDDGEAIIPSTEVTRKAQVDSSAVDGPTGQESPPAPALATKAPEPVAPERAASPQTVADMALRRMINGPMRLPMAVPLGVRLCVEYIARPRTLKFEGLFRVSGSKMRIDELYQGIIDGEVQSLDDEFDPYTVCGLLKKIMREANLPIPTKAERRLLRAIEGARTEQQRVKRIRKVLSTLREEEFESLRVILLLFLKIIAQDGNRMTVSNLATSVGPSLFSSIPTQKSTIVLAVVLPNYVECFAKQSQLQPTGSPKRKDSVSTQPTHASSRAVSEDVVDFDAIASPAPQPQSVESSFDTACRQDVCSQGKAAFGSEASVVGTNDFEHDGDSEDGGVGAESFSALLAQLRQGSISFGIGGEDCLDESGEGDDGDGELESGTTILRF
eukprot:m.110023 g.110023  ORF g.110023 m.110023 type:complete len:450 (-) comp13384_c0_seq3:438-1787(-)